MPKDTKTLKNDVFQLDEQKLRAELEKIHTKAQNSSESAGTLGQQRKMAAEGLGCHPKALKAIEDIDTMGEQKLGDFLRSFEVMFESMLPDWRTRIQDMLDRAEGQADDMETDMEG